LLAVKPERVKWFLLKGTALKIKPMPGEAWPAGMARDRSI